MAGAGGVNPAGHIVVQNPAQQGMSGWIWFVDQPCRIVLCDAFTWGALGGVITFAISDRGNLPVDFAITTESQPLTYNNQNIVVYRPVANYTFAAVQTYHFTLTASAAGFASVEQAITIPVGPTAATLWTATAAPMPEATVGVAYSFQAVQIGSDPGTATFALLDRGNLPESAAINSSTSVISVTLTAEGTYTFVVRATHTAYNVGREVTVTLSTTGETTPKLQVTLATGAALYATVNAAYSQTLGVATINGTSNVGVWTLANRGNLPSGAALTTAGLLTATFTTAAVYSFVVRATNPDDAADFIESNIQITAAAAGTTPPTASITPPTDPVESVESSDVATEWYVHRIATDDGAGGLAPVQDSVGTVDYDNGILAFPPEMFFVSKKWYSTRTGGGGEWQAETIADRFANGSDITVTYKPYAIEPETATETLPAQPITFSLTPYSTDSCVPGTIQFRIGSTIYQDNEGVIQHTVNPTTGVGTTAGTINYDTGEVTLINWVAGSTAFTLLSLATYKGQFTETAFFFRTSGSPLRPGGFQIATTALDGELLAGSADLSGNITGNEVEGLIDVEYGLLDLRFGETVLDSSLSADQKLEDWYDPDDVDGTGHIWKPRKVIPQTARYNCVVYSYLPLPASLLGLNPVRLPMDGRVPFCRPGDSCVVHHTASLTLPNPVSGGSTHSVGRTGLARIWLKDATGQTVPGGIGGKYSADLDTGVVTMAVGLDLTGYTQPLTAYHLIASEALVTDVDVSGQVRLARALQQAFPMGSYLSTSLRIGDLGARVTVPFSQQSWTSVWSDSRIGNPINPQFSHSIWPIRVTNDGAVKERWRTEFVTATTVNVIGESLGVIATGLSILADIAPINPVTGNPYFTIPHQGWGAGWPPGSLLRHNTDSADYPIAALRCVQQGPPGAAADRLGIEFLGDVDA